MIEEGLQAHLAGDTAIAAYVADRIYPLIMPQSGRLPCLVYTLIAIQRTQSLCATDRKVRGAFQLDTYSKDYKAGKLIAQAVRQSLVDFSGAMGDTRVASISLDSESDLSDPDPGLFRVSQQFTIWYVE